MGLMKEYDHQRVYSKLYWTCTAAVNAPYHVFDQSMRIMSTVNIV